MSQSSGQQTSTARQDPWSAQQPYLQDIFSEANTLYNSNAGREYFPNSTVVPFSPDTESGMSMLRSTAQQGVPGIDGAQGLVTNTMAGGQMNRNDVLNYAANGGMQNPFMGGIAAAGARPTQMGVGQIAASSQQATPFVNDMLAAASRSNDAGIGNLFAGAQGNAFSGAIGAAAGQPGGVNPYLDQMYDRAARQTRDNTNAAFSIGGRYGSGAHADVLSRNLGDMAAQMYGSAYETDRARQMQAAQAQAGLEENRLGRQTQYGELLGARQLGDINRQMGAFGQAAGFGSADLSRLMSGGQALAGIDMADASRNLQAQGLLGQFGEAGINRQIGAANDINQYGLAQTGQGMQAAGLLPMLQQMRQQPGQQMIQLGGMAEDQARQQVQDQVNRWNFNQQAPWDQLGRYSGVIGGLGSLGGTQTSTVQQPTNRAMSGLGGAAAGSSFGPWGALAGGLLGAFAGG